VLILRPNQAEEKLLYLVLHQLAIFA
jgi:hypothetical protein